MVRYDQNTFLFLKEIRFYVTKIKRENKNKKKIYINI